MKIKKMKKRRRQLQCKHTHTHTAQNRSNIQSCEFPAVQKHLACTVICNPDINTLSALVSSFSCELF